MKSELNQIKRNTNICIFVLNFSLHALNLCEIHTCMQNCQEYYTPKNKTIHHCLSLEDEHVLFNSTATCITFLFVINKYYTSITTRKRTIDKHLLT